VDAGHPFCFGKSLLRARGRPLDELDELLEGMKCWTLEQLRVGDARLGAGLRASIAAHSAGGEPRPVTLWRKEFRGKESARPDEGLKRAYESGRAAAAADAALTDQQLRRHVRGAEYCCWTASEAHCRAAAAALGCDVRVVMRHPSADTEALALKTYPAGGARPTETAVRDLQQLRCDPARAPCVMYLTGAAHYLAVVDDATEREASGGAA